MAFKRRRTYRRKKRRVFSKRQAKAIVAISSKPVETKHFPQFGLFTSYLNTAGYVSGPSLIFIRNIYADIPRSSNSLTKDEWGFDGNEIMSRGFRWELHMYATATTPGSMLDVQFRYTLFSQPFYIAGITGVSAADPRLFDQDHDVTPTWSKWNTQAIKIHAQHTFKMDNNGNLNAMTRRKYYTQLRRKVTSQIDASTVANGFMREVKNMQTYWALEVFVPGFATGGDLKTFLNGSIDTNVYFKDA